MRVSVLLCGKYFSVTKVAGSRLLTKTRRSVHHPMGTAAMGKVVDTDLKVKGVESLHVVDASVFPVVISAHLMVATFALAEQAAEIIANNKLK